MFKQHATKCKELNRTTIYSRDHYTKDGCDCDGYHTFGELYEHRYRIFISLCRGIYGINRLGKAVAKHQKMDENLMPFIDLWRSKLHSDGTMFHDSFVVGIHKEKGEQITYHFPLKMWDEFYFIEELERAPEWDGHTPDDVVERLKHL